MSFEMDELISSLISVALAILFILCLCYYCPCCIWNRRRNQGTVYHTVDQQRVNSQYPSVNPDPNVINHQGAYPIQPGLTAYTTHFYNPAVAGSLPVSQQIVVNNTVQQPAPYVIPQNAYPPPQALPGNYMMPVAGPPSMAPHPMGPPSMAPHPMGHPSMVPHPMGHPPMGHPPMAPPHIAAMPMPMSQPPPYSEVVQTQSATGGNAPEAYAKQAAYNPNFN